MSDQFIGEIRQFGFNFAPYGWALCNGQTMSISQNTALFSLIGTYYGGDGITTFALPNLQSRVPIHQGQGVGLSPYVLGQIGGFENVTLNSQQMPQHNHNVNVLGLNATTNKAAGSYLADSTGGNVYTTSNPNNTLNVGSITYAGGNQPHANVQPYLTISFCIALVGIYPSRN
jgi:microcystin-dependent protein